MSEPNKAVRSAADASFVDISPANRPPLCKVSGKVGPRRKVMLRLDQEPGALLRTLGDRTDDVREGEPYNHAGPFAHAIIEAFAGIANGNLPEDMEGQFPADGVNAMLQAMSAFEPTNELEGMIAAQAVALHYVTLDSLVCARRSERSEFRQQHLSAANKSARTFAALVETLNRHRGKTTTQRVIVENVHVNAGGQAVVGAVAGMGVGDKRNGEVQSHADTQGSAGGAGDSAAGAALLGANTARHALPAGGGERQETMPDARRRSRDRRTEGQQEPARSRTL